MNTTSLKNKLMYLVTGSAVLCALAISGTAFAQSTPAPTTAHSGWSGAGHTMGRMPGVFGTVASVDVANNTLTITSKAFGPKPAAGTTVAAPTPVTYTVDATNAKVTKSGAASTLSAVTVGDSVMVQGTVSGQNVTATTISDGMEGAMGRAFGKTGQNASQKPTPVVQGNGQPVVGGAITAINGNTISITNKSNVSYSVDASSATIVKGNVTSTISGLSVGDNVVVQGTVSGSSVTAYSVTDSGAASANASTPATPGKGLGGFFGGLGNFFHNLFGFF